MAKNTPKSKISTKSQRSNVPTKPKSSGKTKKQTCIDLLKRPKGASLAELQKVTGWQAHSVRGFLSGTVKKLEGIRLISEAIDSGERRYRIETKTAS